MDVLMEEQASVNNSSERQFIRTSDMMEHWEDEALSELDKHIEMGVEKEDNDMGDMMHFNLTNTNLMGKRIVSATTVV